MKKTITIFVIIILTSLNAFSQQKGFWLDASLEAGTELFPQQPISPDQLNTHTTYGLNMAFGYRFIPQFALGGGFGLNRQIKNDVVKINDKNYSMLAIPIYARLRYDAMQNIVSPYINLDLGYAIPTKNGFFSLCAYGIFAKIDVGASFKIENGHRLYIGCKSGIISNINEFAIPIMCKIGFEF